MTEGHVPKAESKQEAGPPAAVQSCAICSVVTKRRWNPYIVGILIGVLSWGTFYGMKQLVGQGKALGTSTTIAKSAGAITGIVAPQHVADNAYYAKYFNPPKKNMFDWQFFLVVSMIVGAVIAHRTSGVKEKPEHVPALWAWRFGRSKAFRYTAAFVGGAILLFGARMAGGCTSGHGLSGGMQLALSSWAFFFAMFASGVITAFALFGMKGRNHVHG